MQKDIVEPVQSVLFENIINVLKLLPLNQPPYHNEGSFKTRMGSCQSKIAQSCLFGELAPTDDLKLTHSKPSVQLFAGGTSDSENIEARLKLAASSDVTNSASYKKHPLKVDVPNVANPDSCGQQVFKGELPEIFLLPVPSDKVMQDHLVENEATVAINNFKMAFRLAYKNSLINIDQMETVFLSVCNSDRDGDSGIFMMKLICDYNRDKTFLFRPEHAKPIREILTYYMVAHPFNEKMPPETKRILQKHNVAYDYSTPGYYPWMHEQSESVSEDSSYFSTK